jgi:hypothetical protein
MFTIDSDLFVLVLCVSWLQTAQHHYESLTASLDLLNPRKGLSICPKYHVGLPQMQVARGRTFELSVNFGPMHRSTTHSVEMSSGFFLSFEVR